MPSTCPGEVACGCHERLVLSDLGLQGELVMNVLALRRFADLEGDFCGLIVALKGDPLPDRLRLVPDQPAERRDRGFLGPGEHLFRQAEPDAAHAPELTVADKPDDAEAGV